ncbi:DDE superfamily endonuclease-domain-containing protein [Annulohypoxylon bovei var. microspora]|nr:DDE superfamily endonuclease-domain-containing protein [Annulohypoxylon bovei var. microspora]
MDSSSVSVPKRKKTGRTHKCVSKRVFSRITPYTRNKPRNSNKKKKDVLTWLVQVRVPLRQSIAVFGYVKPHRQYPTDEFEPPETGFRRPTFVEAAAFFKIPSSTVRLWWHRRDDILEGDYNKNGLIHPSWPDLEDKLYIAFLERRSQNKAATRAWFKVNAARLFKQLYESDLEAVFVFSSGWFTNFLKRHCLSRRRITKHASKAPAEIKEACIRYCLFIRKHSLPSNDLPTWDPILASQLRSSPPPALTTSFSSPPGSPLQSIDEATDEAIDEAIESPPDPDSIESLPRPSITRRFPLWRILNLDETPIPFEFLDGYTYETTGARTIAVRTDRSGWNKRQATLLLCIDASGRIFKPLVIFHGSDTKGEYDEERKSYPPGVLVLFNEKAYNNEPVFHDWIRNELARYTMGEKALLTMDVAGFHNTEGIKRELRDDRILPAMIPGGMTSHIQVLDTHLNKVVKQLLRNFHDLWMQNREDEYEAKGIPAPPLTTRDQRIKTTFIIDQMIQELKRPVYQELIRKGFKQTGASVRPDGSEDNLIKIKGLSEEDHRDLREALKNQGNIANAVEPATVIDSFAPELSGADLDETEVIEGPGDTVRSPYFNLTNKELKLLLKNRNLTQGGNKAVLVERLLRNDQDTLDIDDWFD